MPISELKVKIARSGFNQTEIATKFETTKQHMSNMVNGNCNISLYFKVKFADLFEMSLEEFEKLIT